MYLTQKGNAILNHFHALNPFIISCYRHTFSLQVNVKRAKFPFEQDMEGLFASLSGSQQHFSGATEIARVETNLRDNYPSRLKRAARRTS